MSSYARELWDLGIRDLVCVTPPGGRLSPSSRIAPEAMGKAPGRLNQQGQWGGYDWQRHQATEEDVAKWDHDRANIGIKGSTFPAFDIDVDNPEMAALISNLIQKKLGLCIMRSSRPPRLLLAYQAAVPGEITRHRLRFHYEGEEHMVELLGDGQQWVASGLHPSGLTYSSTVFEPKYLDTDTALTTLHEIDTFIEMMGGVITGRESSDRKERQDVDQDGLKGEIHHVAEIVRAIPNDDQYSTREDYLRIGYAIKGASQDDPEAGFAIWLEWCDRWTDGVNDPETVRADWDRMHGPYELGVNYLEDHARSFGYNLAQDAFPPLDPAPEGQQVVNDAELEYAYADQTLAQRFTALFGDGVKHAEGAGWFAWDGTMWIPRADKLVTTRFADFLMDLSRRAFSNPELTTKQAEMLASKLGSRTTLMNVMSIAADTLQCAIDADDFDPDPMLLNTPGGIVSLADGALGPHRKEALCSLSTSYTPDAELTPSRWYNFLWEVTGGDVEFVHYLQRLAGYAATGLTKEQVLPFLYGPGGNGKSVFVNTVLSVLGSYGKVAAMSTFLASRGESHPTDVASLKGARLVTAQETREGQAWDESKVKALTGGEPITARYMRQDFFTFTPKFTLLMSGNHRPHIESLDPAWKRRMHLIPFHFVPAEIDYDLEENLLEHEGPAILHWILNGTKKWNAEGLGTCNAVRAATEEYFYMQDPLGRWLEEKTVTDDGHFSTSKELYEDWQTWCILNHEPTHVGSLMGLSVKLQAALGDKIRKGKHPDPTNRRKGFWGIKLLEDVIPPRL